MPEIIEATRQLTADQKRLLPYPAWEEVSLDDLATHPQVAGRENPQLFVPDPDNEGEFLPYRHPGEGDRNIYISSANSMTVTALSPGRLGAMAVGLQNADYIGINPNGPDGTAYKLFGDDGATLMSITTYTSYGLNYHSVHLWLPQVKAWQAISYPGAPEADRFAEIERFNDSLPRRTLTAWTEGLRLSGWTEAQVTAVREQFVESGGATGIDLMAATIANATERGESRMMNHGVGLPLY